MKQGGAWVGQLAGIQWTAVHSPLDADGIKATQRLQWVTINAEFQGALGALRAQHMSAGSGVSEMISKDTAKYTLVFYAVADGNPSSTPPQPDLVKALFVMKGLWHYTGPDTAESKETLAVYLPDGNPDHNVLPAPGATPFMVQNYDWHPQYRVPEL